MPLPPQRRPSSDDLLSRAIQLLDKLVEDHASIRCLMQQQHDVLTLKIENVTDRSSSLAWSSPLSMHNEVWSREKKKVENISLAVSSYPPPLQAEYPSGPSDISPCPPMIPSEPARSVLTRRDSFHDIANGFSNTRHTNAKPDENKCGAAKPGDHPRVHGIDDENYPPPERSLITRIVLSKRFELASGIVILINTCIMFVILQLRGKHEAHRLGLNGTDDYSFASLDKYRFNLVENVFNTLYLLELILRSWVYGRDFFRSSANICDAFIVMASCVDSFVLSAITDFGLNLSVLRLVRMCRVLRLTKFLRTSSNFSEMRVLISTLCRAFRGCLWITCALFGLILGGGLLMAQITLDLLEDESISPDRRVWAYKTFGSATNSVHTMFESTFTGGWRFYSRPLIEEISPFFVVFWVMWIVGVNFVTMRVAAALFLKQTLAVAAQEEERIAMESLKLREKFAGSLRAIFQAADTSGDGAICKAEFDVMMQDPQIVSDFARLDLGIDEVTALFDVLSSEDGESDYEEFLAGALKMNCTARTLDSIKLMHSQLHISRLVEQVLTLVEPFAEQGGQRRAGTK